MFGCVTKIHEVINKFPIKYRSHSKRVIFNTFYGESFGLSPLPVIVEMKVSVGIPY